MSTPQLPVSRPLRYVIHCAGCDAEVEICPDELDDKIAACPECGLPNPTPIYGLLKNNE